MCKVIAIANQKGGVGKTTTTCNLGIGLARIGSRVLLIDLDSQGSLTSCLGIREPDELEISLANVLESLINDEEINVRDGLIHHEEGVDLIPGNIELSGLEVTLVNTMNRERVLQQYINVVKNQYDYILIDCMPSLGMLTINALACADSVLIPVQAEYLPTKGLQQLLRTISKVKRQINPKLQIEGIVFTMVDERTNLAKDLMYVLNRAYQDSIKFFVTHIPRSVRGAETPAKGISIFKYDQNGKIAAAYSALTLEVYQNGESGK